MPDSQPLDRTPLACVQCRSRHVKCDATQPPCSRCRREGKECSYQASRRGGLDRAALARRRLRLQQEAEAARQNPVNQARDLEHNPQSSAVVSNIAQQSQMAIQVSGDRLLDLYYANAWPPFPVALPHRQLRERLQNNPEHGLGVLLTILHWYGAIYASWTSSDPYYENALQALQQPAATPFNVQALMLLAVGQHQCDKKESARATMDLAVSMALQLRMNEKDFARTYGEGDAVLEESWRRTYYFLYNFDQEFAIISRGLTFVTMNIPMTVELPCDDEEYESGVGVISY